MTYWVRRYIFLRCENVEDFIGGIDNQIKLVEIPIDLPCAYLKGHILGRARDWYDIFASALVQNTATDFAQLKAALTKNFPVVRNRKDLETQFYASQQNRDQDPTDFIYDQLKVHKKLGRPGNQNAVADVLSRNPVENIIGEKFIVKYNRGFGTFVA
ncbi:uncharacterized protein TNCV_4711851 [Trichonephila clavipes]|nr:uncharacterized protein TNCV_4711851 [Trichonephila clavipes]